jgi:hypothetical protein
MTTTAPRTTQDRYNALWDLLGDATTRTPAQEAARTAATNYLQTLADLGAKVDELARDMAYLQDKLEHRQHVNAMGEVQSTGRDIDRLCALHEERIQTVHMIAICLPTETERRTYLEIVLGA